MDKTKIADVNKLILKLHSCKGEKNRNIARNDIYLEIKPFMLRWLASIFSNKGVYKDDDEMLSISWDCFEYALQHYKYKKKIPIPNHFYKYSVYFIKNMISKNISKYKEAPIHELNNLETNDYNEKLYSDLDELKAFRSELPDNYKIVFNDALMSLAPGNKDRVNNISTTTLSAVRYQESKKIFKWVISFLIKR